MRIGFVGLGTMGRAMAARLVEAGHEVRVWNRSPGPAADLAARGAITVPTPADAGEGAEVLVSMLADDNATRSTVIDSGLIDALPKGAIHANMATVSVELAQDFTQLHAERGLGYVAAPVLGRANVAEAGQLQILAAGDPALLDRLEPLFSAMGSRTWMFGENPVQANAVKLAANFMIASAIGTMGEAATLAAGHGVAPSAFLEMVTSTVFAAPVYRTYGTAIAEEAFSPAGFRLELGLKDVKLALAAGEAARVPMGLAGILRDHFLDSLAHGEGDLDWAAVSRAVQRRAGQGPAGQA
nr:NAD(P)-dependent oxidoreductase [Novosphingobium nitrogenifigens]